MKKNTLSVTDAVRNFSDYINRVSYRHESFILCRGRARVAELRPVPAGRRFGDLPGILQDLPSLSESNAQAFIEDIQTNREHLPGMDERDPWAS